MAISASNAELTPGSSYLYAGSQMGIDAILLDFGALDRFVINGEQTDVKAARDVISRSQLGAFGAKRLLLITNAHCLTEVVQNTFLKLLEEPPSSLVVVLQSERSNQLLPTVISRLHTLKTMSRSSNPAVASPDADRRSVRDQSIFRQPSAGLFERLTAMDREQTLELLCRELDCQRQDLLRDPTAISGKRLALLDMTINKLRSNANYKLSIESMLLRWDEL